MHGRLKNMILKISRILGWTILGLSLAVSIFCAAAILGNHSEYDCNLSTAADMGVMALLPAISFPTFAVECYQAISFTLMIFGAAEEVRSGRKMNGFTP